MKEQLAKHFLEPAPGTREELAKFIERRVRDLGQGRHRPQDHRQLIKLRRRVCPAPRPLRRRRDW
ncbi:MAG: hypothetical protein MZW92_30860 [Comamonadaceae bacterium]|nr:hypothetical protein [Comamonadaceae bacterium]